MSRAIKIFGIGFSADDNDAEIEVAVDGNVIYTGAVTTDTNFDLKEYLLGSDLGEEEVASWVEGDAATTTKSLSIKALSGNFLYTETLTTYIGEENLENPELFGVYSYTEADGDVVADPNSNIFIDGAENENGSPDDRSELFGQWSVGIPEGSTMTCNLIIDEAIFESDSTDEDSTDEDSTDEESQ